MKDALGKLRENLTPFLVFWEEWTANENCNLTAQEITLINHHLAAGFETSFLDNFASQEKVEEIEKIAVKLSIAQRVFKEWVVVKFLVAIVTMAKEYGYTSFINSPINKLNIPEEQRSILKNLKVYSLQQLFIIYRAEDFGRTWLFAHIVQFLQTVKKMQPVALR